MLSMMLVNVVPAHDIMQKKMELLSNRQICRQIERIAKMADLRLTHAVTHEQKNRGGNNGEKRIHG